MHLVSLINLTRIYVLCELCADCNIRSYCFYVRALIERKVIGGVGGVWKS